jgi:ribonuclease D
MPKITLQPKNLPDDCLGKISGEEINALELAAFEGPVHLVSCPEDINGAFDTLKAERVIGFDTESRPAFKKGSYFPPSIVQLAGAEAVYIIQIGAMGFPPELAEIFEDDSIIKAGVAVHNDVKELKDLSEFNAAGFVDLGEVAEGLGMATRGLRNMAANLLGLRISKSARCTNWAKPVLTDKQIIYAATDAWIGRELYLKLSEMGCVFPSS